MADETPDDVLNSLIKQSDESVTDGVIEQQSKLELYGNALYAQLIADSEVKQVDGTDETIHVWTGRVVQTCLDVGIPEGSYKRVIDALTEIGCIQILSRGVRQYPSVVALLSAPAEDDWKIYEANLAASGLTRRETSATLTQQAKDVIKSMGGINILEAFKHYDNKISSLELRVRVLEQASGISTETAESVINDDSNN